MKLDRENDTQCMEVLELHGASLDLALSLDVTTNSKSLMIERLLCAIYL